MMWLQFLIDEFYIITYQKLSIYLYFILYMSVEHIYMRCIFYKVSKILTRVCQLELSRQIASRALDILRHNSDMILSSPLATRILDFESRKSCGAVHLIKSRRLSSKNRSCFSGYCFSYIRLISCLFWWDLKKKFSDLKNILVLI